MKEFDVFFELYGKKMKTTVCAGSKKEAEKIVREKLIIHKVVPNTKKRNLFEDNPFNDTAFENLMDILGMNNKT